MLLRFSAKLCIVGLLASLASVSWAEPSCDGDREWLSEQRSSSITSIAQPQRYPSKMAISCGYIQWDKVEGAEPTYLPASGDCTVTYDDGETREFTNQWSGAMIYGLVTPSPAKTSFSLEICCKNPYACTIL